MRENGEYIGLMSYFGVIDDNTWETITSTTSESGMVPLETLLENIPEDDDLLELLATMSIYEREPKENLICSPLSSPVKTETFELHELASSVPSPLSPLLLSIPSPLSSTQPSIPSLLSPTQSSVPLPLSPTQSSITSLLSPTQSSIPSPLSPTQSSVPSLLSPTLSSVSSPAFPSSTLPSPEFPSPTSSPESPSPTSSPLSSSPSPTGALPPVLTTIDSIKKRLSPDTTLSLICDEKILSEEEEKLEDQQRALIRKVKLESFKRWESTDSESFIRHMGFHEVPSLSTDYSRETLSSSSTVPLLKTCLSTTMAITKPSTTEDFIFKKPNLPKPSRSKDFIFKKPSSPKLNRRKKSSPFKASPPKTRKSKTKYLDPGPSTSKAKYFDPGPSTSKAKYFDPGPSTSKAKYFDPGSSTSMDTFFDLGPTMSMDTFYDPGPSTSMDSFYDPGPSTSIDSFYDPGPSTSRATFYDPGPSTSRATFYDPGPSTSRAVCLDPRLRKSAGSFVKPQLRKGLEIDLRDTEVTLRKMLKASRPCWIEEKPDVTLVRADLKFCYEIMLEKDLAEKVTDFIGILETITKPVIKDSLEIPHYGKVKTFGTLFEEHRKEPRLALIKLFYPLEYIRQNIIQSPISPDDSHDDKMDTQQTTLSAESTSVNVKKMSVGDEPTESKIIKRKNYYTDLVSTGTWNYNLEIMTQIPLFTNIKVINTDDNVETSTNSILYRRVGCINIFSRKKEISKIPIKQTKQQPKDDD